MEIPDYYEFGSRAHIMAGHDALEQIPGLLSSMDARNPMVITDQGVRRAGLVDILLQALDSRITAKTIQDDVPADSDLNTVHTLAGQYRKHGCNAIIALGGGSVMDTAKGVNILVSTSSDDLLAFSGANALTHALNPLVAVPTTAGTGSEVTRVAVISDPDNLRKLLFTSGFLIPDAAVLDPRMTMTLPAPVTAATAMDALSHAVESCLCLGRNPLSTAHAHEAITLISQNLVPVIQQPDHKPGRLALATGAALAGMAFSNSMVGMVHTLGHSVGSVCHAAHGTCMAVLLPYGMAYNLHKTQHLLADLLLPMAGADVYARTHPAERAQKAIDWVGRMNRRLNQATDGAHAVCLREIKSQDGKSRVPRHLLPRIAHTALGDGSIFYNPEDLDYDDCLMVLEAAFDGAALDLSRVKKG